MGNITVAQTNSCSTSGAFAAPFLFELRKTIGTLNDWRWRPKAWIEPFGQATHICRSTQLAWPFQHRSDSEPRRVRSGLCRAPQRSLQISFFDYSDSVTCEVPARDSSNFKEMTRNLEARPGLLEGITTYQLNLDPLAERTAPPPLHVPIMDTGFA